MATMLNGFTLMTVSYFYMDFIIGIVLITALCLSSDFFFKKKTGRRSMDVPDSTAEVGP
jgi:ABC-type xylose transport system permease subunit